MRQRKNSIFGLITISLFILMNSGCSESEDTGKRVEKEMMTQQEKELSGQSKKVENIGDNENTRLDQLVLSAEQASEKAHNSGFAWTTIAPLMAQAHEARKKGDMALAFDLFSQAKTHSELAIQQANYADKHWQLLEPTMN